MIEINGKQYRNLEEQVQANLDNIKKHYDIDRVIADYGIHVIGELADPAELQDKVGAAWGNAYAVGTSAPYTFYIWTRNSPETEDITDGYWFNIGQLAIEGPQGPQGETGATGATGQRGATIWTFSGETGDTPTLSSLPDILVGDYALNLANGEFWRYVGVSRFVLLGVIRGAQGIQGPVGPQGPQGIQGIQGIQGPQGDPGKFIHIAGIIASADQLISPSELRDLSKAYLVGSASPYALYIQVGETVDDAMWVNTGDINVGTTVYVSGAAVETWNSDTKLDKNAGTANVLKIYGTNGTSQVMYTLTGLASANTVPYRDASGNIAAPTESVQETGGDDVYISAARAKTLISEALANTEIPTIGTPLYEHNITITDTTVNPLPSLRTSIYTDSDTAMTAYAFIQYLYEKRCYSSGGAQTGELKLSGDFEIYVDYYDESTNTSKIYDSKDVYVLFDADTDSLRIRIVYDYDYENDQDIYCSIDWSNNPTVNDVVNLVAQAGSSSGGGKLYRHNIQIALGSLPVLLERYTSTDAELTLTDLLPITDEGDPSGVSGMLIGSTFTSSASGVLINTVLAVRAAEDSVIVFLNGAEAEGIVTFSSCEILVQVVTEV